ncbi:hypothetical protein [Haliangium ochraceum]|uniref:Uncharacterized protein n=1 Tax=Haliangium ochraceum (strain DSM 14365 / JCM 11303 / SMP-2) TaxID=502025 RepID=D0LR86_HALO1|nr:hypothetical protein [Haliangium ochraceum]ACY17114.1 hypothetical protein Hoch_4623 [Haliangium ochraceum DSM 14365]
MNQMRETLFELAVDPFAREMWGEASEADGGADELTRALRGLSSPPQGDELAAALQAGNWSRCPICGDPGPDPLPGAGVETAKV